MTKPIQTMTAAIAFAAPNEGKGDSVVEPTIEETTAPTAEVNSPLVVVTDETIVDSIGKALRNREVFPTVAAAVAKLINAQTALTPKLADGSPDPEAAPFFGIPVRVKGADADGNIDETLYEGMNAALAIVGARVDGPKAGGPKISGIKAIVIFPIPSIDAFIASPEGKVWLAKITEKEAAHVFFRGLRDAATTIDLSNGMTKGPGTVAEYVSEYSRSGSGGLDTDTFDALWTTLRKSLLQKMPALAKLLPSKQEVLNSIRSKAFALENHKDLETHPTAGSIFARIGLALIDMAKQNTVNGTASPLPTEAVESWLAGRDELVLASRKEEKDFSVLSGMDISF